MKKLRLKLTRRGHLRLTRGGKTVTVRGIGELEKLAHQAWDLALQRRDLMRDGEISEIFGASALRSGTK
jgi:hypothetical protein